VREQSAFRHPDLIGENPEGDAGEAGLAHQGESFVKDPLAS
jgi:hypothetical protein